MTKLALTPEQQKDLATLDAYLILRDGNGGHVETAISHPEVLKVLAFEIGGFVKSMTMVQRGVAMLFYRDYDAKSQTFGDYYA